MHWVTSNKYVFEELHKVICELQSMVVEMPRE